MALPVTVPFSSLLATKVDLVNVLENEAVELLLAAAARSLAVASPVFHFVMVLVLPLCWFELLFCCAVEFSLAFGPAPVCVEVAVAV
ncbi:hypothetical protein EUB48_06120 [Rhodoferax sediminis]|uniref:Uncharacterized protein n=1 Tax=Rhodoferax sediminis TaxID=2509614 RepID=A0A515D918_9BURK|nr:hypothetical protein EUB48_06120 [Rhodoferax sediminis]